MYFDDEGPSAIEAPGARERAAALAADPERQTLVAIEFDAQARALVTKSISYGQARSAFLKSMADYWDTVVAQFAGMMSAQQKAIAKAAADVAAPAAATTSLCKHCDIEGPHEHVTGGSGDNPDAKPMRDSAGYPAKDPA